MNKFYESIMLPRCASTWLYLLISPVYVLTQDLGYYTSYGKFFQNVHITGILLASSILGCHFILTSRNQLNKITCVYLLICIHIILVAILEYFFGSANEFRFELLAWSVINLSYMIVFFLVGFYLNINKLIKPLILLSSLSIWRVFANINDSGVYSLGDIGADSTNFASYQGIARSFLMFLLILSCMVNVKSYIKAIIISLGIASLYIIGSRTDFVLYIISIFVLNATFAIAYKKKNNKFIPLLFASVFIGISLFYLLPDNRIHQLINITSSTSFIGRLQYHNFAVNEIFRNPFLGSYGSYTALGGVGFYPHNILSAWINLGIVGFILYLLLFSLLWTKAILQIKNKNISHEFRFFYSLLVFVTLALLFSKTYNYMLVGLVVGFSKQINDSEYI